MLKIMKHTTILQTIGTQKQLNRIAESFGNAGYRQRIRFLMSAASKDQISPDAGSMEMLSSFLTDYDDLQHALISLDPDGIFSLFWIGDGKKGVSIWFSPDDGINCVLYNNGKAGSIKVSGHEIAGIFDLVEECGLSSLVCK